MYRTLLTLALLSLTLLGYAGGGGNPSLSASNGFQTALTHQISSMSLDGSNVVSAAQKNTQVKMGRHLITPVFQTRLSQGHLTRNSFIPSQENPDRWIRQVPGKKSGAKTSTSPPFGGVSGTARQAQARRINNGASGDYQGGGATPNIGTESLHAEQSNPEQPLTITFVGRFDAGKSSLANAVLGFDHFPINEVRTKEREDDVVISPSSDQQPSAGKLRIRSLPGYAAIGETNETWFSNNPILPSEILVFVFGGSMKTNDVDVLKEIIRNGHPFNQIIFVRNKFDKTLDAEMDIRNIPAENQGRRADIAVSLQQQISKEFFIGMNRIFPGKTPVLHFTACPDSMPYEGIDALLDVILACVGKRFGGQPKLKAFTDFLYIRKSIPEKTKLYTADFLRVLNDSVNDPVMTVIETHVNPGRDNPVRLREQLASFRDAFRQQYYSYEDKVTRLRYLSTWDATELEMVKHHADELVCRRRNDRKDYIHALHESAAILRERVPKQDLQDAFDISAAYKAVQYIAEFSDQLRNSMARELWIRTKKKKEELLSELQRHLTRAIEAELFKAWCRTLLKESDYLVENNASQNSETGFGGGLEGQKQQFAHLAVKTLMRKIVLRDKYGLLKDKNEQPTLKESLEHNQSETLSPELTLPESGNDSVNFAIVPEHERVVRQIDPIPFQPESMPPRPASEGSLLVTLPSGFTREYSFIDSPYFSRQELAVVLAAFDMAVFEERDGLGRCIKEESGSPVRLTVTDQSGHIDHYFYKFNGQKALAATGMNRVLLEIGEVDEVNDLPQKLYQDADSIRVNNIRPPIQIDFKGCSEAGPVIGMLARNIRELNDHPFSPRAFVHQGQEFENGLERTLILTTEPVTNLGLVMILQNSPPAESSDLLGGFTLSGHERLNDDDLLKLSLSLAEGLEKVRMQCSVSSIDVQHIGIDIDTMQAYWLDPSLLRTNTQNDFERDALQRIQDRMNICGNVAAAEPLQETHLSQWLGQAFVLLSSYAPIFYKKKILTRVRQLTHDDLDLLNSFKDDQLRSFITDVLIRDRISPRRVPFRRKFPDVIPGRTVQQNLLLLARGLLKSDPRKRKKLQWAVEGLRQIQATSEIDEFADIHP